jgi:hypothetical protein
VKRPTDAHYINVIEKSKRGSAENVRARNKPAIEKQFQRIEGARMRVEIDSCMLDIMIIDHGTEFVPQTLTMCTIKDMVSNNIIAIHSLSSALARCKQSK